MIRGQDYSGGVVEDNDLYHVSPRLAASFDRAKVIGGDLLMSIVGYVGTVAEVPNSLSGANLTQTTARIAVKPELCGRYFLHFFRSSFFRDEVKRYMKGSAQPGLNLADVEKMTVAFPTDQAERLSIADTLDTLDTAIRETVALIDKLKAVKQGLLHDLLTRGIDASGQLRPPQSEAPQLYKESPLGWIPREWNVRQVQELGEAITGSTPPSTDPLAWGLGIPFITPGDIESDRPISFVERQVSLRGQKYVRLLPAGSSLVVCIGSTIGKVGMTSAVACTNQQINAVVPGDGTDSAFLFHSLQMHAGQLRALAGLQAVPIVNKSSFESIMLPSPLYEEQVEISARVSAISTRLNSEAEQLEKLRQQKNGLMDDLLTGRVRVTPLLESVQQPAAQTGA